MPCVLLEGVVGNQTRGRCEVGKVSRKVRRAMNLCDDEDAAIE